MDKDRWKPKFNVFFSECREFLRYLEFEIQTKLIFSKQQEDWSEFPLKFDFDKTKSIENIGKINYAAASEPTEP